MGLLGNVLGSIGGSAVSSLLGQKEARRNRKYQAYMSNTAHQREVNDLRAAGLNPVLSAGGMGASTPHGAMAPISDLGQAFKGGMSNAIQAKAVKAQVANTMATTEQNVVRANLDMAMYDEFKKSSPEVKAAILGQRIFTQSGGKGLWGTLFHGASSAYKKAQDTVLKGVNAMDEFGRKRWEDEQKFFLNESNRIHQEWLRRRDQSKSSTYKKKGRKVQ